MGACTDDAGRFIVHEFTVLTDDGGGGQVRCACGREWSYDVAWPSTIVYDAEALLLSAVAVMFSKRKESRAGR